VYRETTVVKKNIPTGTHFYSPQLTFFDVWTDFFGSKFRHIWPSFNTIGNRSITIRIFRK